MTAAETARVARLFAEPSRVAMFDVLMDGFGHPVSDLARAAAVSHSTAVGHVDRLERAGLVVSRRDGRRRLVSLAGPAAASLYEALGALTPPGKANGLRAANRRESLVQARTCFDHLAGRLGVAIADAAISAGALGEDFGLSPSAPEWFTCLGVDLESLPRGRRPLLRTCLDWTERRFHIAGALGAAVCRSVLDAGWVARRPDSRALNVTPLGRAELERLGVRLSQR